MRCWSGRQPRWTKSSKSGSGTTCSSSRSSGQTCARRQTGPESASEAHRAALALLEEAEALFGKSYVLYRAGRRMPPHSASRAWPRPLARDAAAVPPQTAWEHDAAGRVLLASGDLSGALAAFEHAIALRPQDFWPHFHEGVCAFRLGRYSDAATAFRVCVALAPDQAECFYNRAWPTPRWAVPQMQPATITAPSPSTPLSRLNQSIGSSPAIPTRLRNRKRHPEALQAAALTSSGFQSTRGPRFRVFARIQTPSFR